MCLPRNDTLWCSNVNSFRIAAGKVSPTQLIPLLWYQLLLAVFTIIYIAFPQISNKTLNFIDKNKK